MILENCFSIFRLDQRLVDNLGNLFSVSILRSWFHFQKRHLMVTIFHGHQTFQILLHFCCFVLHVRLVLRRPSALSNLTDSNGLSKMNLVLHELQQRWNLWAKIVTDPLVCPLYLPGPGAGGRRCLSFLWEAARCTSLAASCRKAVWSEGWKTCWCPQEISGASFLDLLKARKICLSSSQHQKCSSYGAMTFQMVPKSLQLYLSFTSFLSVFCKVLKL